MKIMTEVPTDLKGLIGALKSQRQIDMEGDEVGVSRQAVDEVVQFLERYAAAPEVKDEPVAWRFQLDGIWFTGPNEKCCADSLAVAEQSVPIYPLYAHPSTRIAALEAEVVKLRDVAAKLHEYLCSTPQKDFDIPDGVWVPFVTEVLK